MVSMLLWVLVLRCCCSINQNVTDNENNTAPSINLAEILQGQPERPAPINPTAPAAPPGSDTKAADRNILPIVLPVVLGVVVLGAAALVSFKISHMRHAGRVVAAPEPPRGPGGRGMLGE
jgi:hypothetical protein